MFCNRCGVRLLSGGVTYRDRGSSSTVGMAQLLLGLGVLILAGLVLGGGAIILLGSPRATPTHVAAGPTPTGESTSTPPTATLFTLPPTPTLLATATPTPLPTLIPSPTPLPTPSPTPEATPVDCAIASQGTNVRNYQMGLGYTTAKVLPKTWCIRHVTIDQWAGLGKVRLLDENQEVFSVTCLASPCAPAEKDFVPPYQVAAGRTLIYKYKCYDDPATLDVNECADPTPDGAVITISYEAFEGP